VNRSHDSAAALATAVQGVHYDFETAKHIDLSTVDIIINTLPLALEELRFLFDHWNFSAKHILMTLRYDDPSFIAFRARFVGCALDGYLMFKEQARAQQEYWVAITPPLLP
jgi:shikimate 5-dehydrogenase